MSTSTLDDAEHLDATEAATLAELRRFAEEHAARIADRPDGRLDVWCDGGDDIGPCEPTRVGLAHALGY